MTSVVILIVSGILVSLVQADLFLTDNQKGMLAEYHKVCAEPPRADEFLNAVVNCQFLDDQQFKEYLYCLSKRIGFQSESGGVQKSVIVETFKDSITDLANAEKYVETCLKQHGSDSPTEAIYNVIQCLHKISPPKP